MSSPTSDSFVKPSILTTITGHISHIQETNTLTKERFRVLRRCFFQSIGLSVLLYCLFQLLTLFYLLIELTFHFIFQMFMIIFWLPVKIIPKKNNYYILFPLFSLCSVLSLFIAKLSHKNIEIHLGKRSTFLKRYSFIFTFILLLLLQSFFILLPIGISIQEQRKLSPSSIDDIIKLSEKENVKTNTFFKPVIDKREEYVSNRTTKVIINDQNKLLSSRKEDVEIESDIKDDAVDKLQNKAKKILPSTLKEKKKKASNESILEQEQILTFRQKFNSWLDEAWHIWHQTKLDFQHLFSLSREHTYHLPKLNASSIYTAYVDLNCYDYTKTPHLARHIDFLDTYRRRSPFPVYLSILKSNGPKCYRHYPDSSCAIRSKLFFSNLRRQLYYFTRFWLFVSIPITILLVIYKALTDRLDYGKPYLSSSEKQQITSDKTNELSTSNITNNNYSLDKKIEKDLRSWLRHEQNNEYKNLNEICRIALNDTLSKKYEGLKIETLQFTNAKIHDVSQVSVEPTIINAILDIDHLIFNIKDQNYLIDVRKLTGELEILLINHINQYSIEVKFKQIQTNNIEIIDAKNTLSSNDKQSIIKLLKETISQTIVQCCFYLSDNQETILNETQTQACLPPSISQSSNIYQECETPLITPINENHERKSPPKDTKKLLIRIVKAVKLHDVEQPFCTLELNQPKQIHQTSIAKNGLNPFWDERFLFECNDKSNQIRLKIIDHKKPNKRHHTNNLDTIYADVSIPFSYVTSTIYKQDVRITPQHPDSIIRIEFSTLSEEEALAANNGYDNESITDSQNWSNINGREENKIQLDHQSPSSGEFSTLPYDTCNYTSPQSQRTTIYSNADTFSALLTPNDDDDDSIDHNKPRKSQSFMCSLRYLAFPRRKKNHKKVKHNENGVTQPFNNTIQTNSVAHSVSAEPFLTPSTAGPTSFPRGRTISRSFRNLFRSNSKKRASNTQNFILDHPDLLATSTPTRKKRSFFRRFKSKHKPQINASANSLNSYDCTRSESVRNTPIRANVGRPVTMTKTLV